MTDIDSSYNTDLLGLLHSARKHGAKAYTGIGKLSEIANAVGDYGHLPTLIERVREDFNDFIWKVQTPDSPVSSTISKLVNIWFLQQDILSGNKLDDFIVINFTIIKGKPLFDVHPGRTRLYFHNSYFDRVKILFLDYSNTVTEGGIFKLTTLHDQDCRHFKRTEYRLTDNWHLEQMPINHLLVQPNENELWHWPALQEPIKFELKYTNDLLTNITANNKPFMDYTDYVWKINTST
jgi:hypothetical protein|tara:strand:- start:1044 stop:1751 length:708 start_codon:yes stop_codon:yes gene_type:complete